MLLAADVGGTKTLIGLYHPDAERPTPLTTESFRTLDFKDLDALVDTFLRAHPAHRVSALCIGIAGPVTGLTARLTVAPWVADVERLAERFGGCPAALLNDLEAMAYSVAVLLPDELLVLQEGTSEISAGNAAIIAAGTGLGEAHLQKVRRQFVPSASEAGHADFAARTPRELELVEGLSRIHGRVEAEKVISGAGILNLFRFTHGSHDLPSACPVIGPNVAESEMAAAITTTALEERCTRCAEALDMFVSAYGAEAGNLALRSMARAGLYVGGGIAPKILPALQNGAFMNAFVDKAPMEDLMRCMPVKVILNPAAGLVGASVKAASLLA